MIRIRKRIKKYTYIFELITAILSYALYLQPYHYIDAVGVNLRQIDHLDTVGMLTFYYFYHCYHSIYCCDLSRHLHHYYCTNRLFSVDLQSLNSCCSRISMTHSVVNWIHRHDYPLNCYCIQAVVNLIFDVLVAQHRVPRVFYQIRNLNVQIRRKNIQFNSFICHKFLNRNPKQGKINYQKVKLFRMV